MGIASARVWLVATPIRVWYCRLIKNTDYAFNYVINVCEVSAVFAIIENGNQFVIKDRLGEFEKCHVRSSPGTINCEKF